MRYLAIFSMLMRYWEVGGMSEAASLSRRAWYLVIILGTASWSTSRPTCEIDCI